MIKFSFLSPHTFYIASNDCFTLNVYGMAWGIRGDGENAETINLLNSIILYFRMPRSFKRDSLFSSTLALRKL